MKIRKTKRIRIGKALLYVGFSFFGFGVSCIDSAPGLGGGLALGGLGMMLAAQVVGAGR